MAGKKFDWADPDELPKHSAQKLKILSSYFAKYLKVRCSFATRGRLRLAIVDGFAGGGIYGCGSFGSPLILLDTIDNTVNEINISRQDKNLGPIEFEFNIYFNDEDRVAYNLLEGRYNTILARIRSNHPNIKIKIMNFNEKFQTLYPKIKENLVAKRTKNILFNLDQYGDKSVPIEIIRDILTTFEKSEIFLTLMITAINTYLTTKDLAKFNNRYGHLDISHLDLDFENPDHCKANAQVERKIYDNFQSCSVYCNPFFIKNPNGYGYWMLQFTNNYTASQVYKDNLYNFASGLSHFGRSGLKMFGYNPKEDNNLFHNFDKVGIENSQSQLEYDIPEFLYDNDDPMPIEMFFSKIYADTPSHSSVVKSVLIENRDIEVRTNKGGERRVPNTIKKQDMISLKKQSSFRISNQGLILPPDIKSRKKF